MIIKYLVFCITVLYRSEIISYAEKTDSVISDGDSRAKFTNLLNTIVKVSEERVQAMKKMATLEDYLLTKHGEKNDDYYDYDERKDSQKASTEDNERTNISKEDNTYKYDNHTRKVPLKNRSDTSSSEKDSSDDSDELDLPHRQTARCYSVIHIIKGRRSCIKACDRAFENVCDEHRCTRAAERSGERECRKQCRNQFDSA